VKTLEKGMGRHSLTHTTSRVERHAGTLGWDYAK